MGIPLHQQLLVFVGMELEDDLTLSHYDIDNTSTVHLIPMYFGLNNTNDISEVTVNIEDGDTITLQIEPSNTIREIKEKIRDHEGIPVEQQFLAIGGVEVDDDRTLSYYHVGNDSNIHLIRMGYDTSTVVHSSTDPGTVLNISSEPKPLSDFYVACRDNNVAALQKLLQTLPVEEMNKLEPNQSTGLHVACFRGHKEVVKLLLKKGVSRSIMNRYRCLPYEEAASNDIKRLFERIPDNSRYVANSGRVEWLLVAANTKAMAARNVEAIKKYGTPQFEHYAKQIIDNYINPHFQHVEKYEELLGFFNMAVLEKDPRYLIKAYTAETGFYTKLNVDLASETAVGKLERQIYLGILTFNPCFDKFRFSGEVYRGMRLTDDDLEEYGVNKQVMTKSFLSGTVDKNQTDYFLGKFKRKNVHGNEVKMGVICTYIIRDKQCSLDLTNISEYPSEKEVLIFPYTVFTVTQIQSISQNDGNAKKHIILTQC
ncbi:unnamed protein product [Rotaria magnacalcarata]|nr:unnamed protein product [Rotaria magnacalcarata]CAF3926996.1 unnamed protein product [Rotaria magnacalcarata]CAF3930944.1 unnamed protein product [Rotaria magnacalcarata]CAF3991449.1 unnamed protein product [Rotaria magnacalcarata]